MFEIGSDNSFVLAPQHDVMLICISDFFVFNYRPEIRNRGTGGPHDACSTVSRVEFVCSFKCLNISLNGVADTTVQCKKKKKAG